METIKLILASASPRRRELLALLEHEFEVCISDCEEIIRSDSPVEVTKELSLLKADAVLHDCVDDKCIIIGADTVVSLEGNIMGKPANRADAKRMLQSLQGRMHQVTTGVSIIGKTKINMQIKSFAVTTDVTVAPMTEDEIENYLDTEEPYDKAGAYGIQGSFAKHVVGIQGDYNNVVGLPVQRLYEELKKVNL